MCALAEVKYSTGDGDEAAAVYPREAVCGACKYVGITGKAPKESSRLKVELSLNLF